MALHLSVNPSHANVSSLPTFQKDALVVVVDGVNTDHIPISFEIPYQNGLVVEDWRWKELGASILKKFSNYVNTGLIVVKNDNLAVPPSCIIAGKFRADWVLQETYVSLVPGNNGAPTLAYEGIFIGDRFTTASNTVGYRITANTSDEFTYQLYEYTGSWGAVAGHTGTVTQDVIGNYTPAANVTRLYMYISTAAACDVTLDIGKTTVRSISTYDIGITAGAPDASPTGDAGIACTEKDKLFVNIDYVVTGGTPTADMELWARIDGNWAPVNNGAFTAALSTAITGDWTESFSCDKGLERMYVKITNVDAGSTLTKTLVAVNLSD